MQATTTQQTRAVAYYRVSTTEQGDTGHSLPQQRQLIHREAGRNNWNIVEEFEDKYSAKTFQRPGWNQLLQYCKKNQKHIDQVVVKSLDRFGRNLLESLKMQALLLDMGIDLISIDDPMNSEDPFSEAMRQMKLVMAAVENKVRAKKVKDVMRYLMKEGYWCNNAPIGYNNARTAEGKPTLEVDPIRSELVLQAYQKIAKGENQQQVRRWLNSNGVKLYKSKISRLLTNVTYIGQIVVDGEQYPGKYPTIVPKDLFYTVQHIVTGSPVKRYQKDLSDFPLKGLVVCSCGELMTASYSTGRNGNKLPYYHSKSQCKHKPKERINANKLDDIIVAHLGGIKFDKWVGELFFDLIKVSMEQEQAVEQAKHLHLTDRIGQINRQLNKLEYDYLEGKLEAELFQTMRNRLSAEKYELEQQQQEPEEQKSLLANLGQTDFYFLNRLGQLYIRGSVELRRTIVGSIFDENIRISEKQWSNQKLNPIVEELLSVCGAFSGGKKKRELTLSSKFPFSSP